MRYSCAVARLQGGRGLTREEQRILEGEATSSSVDEDIWKPETERGEQALQVNGENPVSLDTKESQEFAQENQVDYDSGGESDDGVHYEVDNETDEDAEARWAREAVDARLKDDPAILAALSRVALGPNVPTAEIVEDSEFGEDPTPSQRVLVEMQEENLFAEGHGLELRAVMSDESWGSSSVDFNKAPDDSETSSSHADLRRWDAIDSPGQTRDLRGFSMAAGLPPAPALGSFLRRLGAFMGDSTGVSHTASHGALASLAASSASSLTLVATDLSISHPTSRVPCEIRRQYRQAAPRARRNCGQRLRDFRLAGS